jgi:hypothetical protein
MARLTGSFTAAWAPRVVFHTAKDGFTTPNRAAHLGDPQPDAWRGRAHAPPHSPFFPLAVSHLPVLSNEPCFTWESAPLRARWKPPRHYRAHGSRWGSSTRSSFSLAHLCIRTSLPCLCHRKPVSLAAPCTMLKR